MKGNMNKPIQLEIIEKIINYLFDGLITGKVFRLLNQTDLEKTIVAAKKELFSNVEIRKAPIKIIIEHLLNASVLHKINISYTRNKRAYFYIGIKNEIESIQAAEILHSIKNNGILCFFSAFEIYELTTQYAPYYHIADLHSISKPAVTHHVTSSTKVNENKKPRNVLGTKEIIYNDVTYYLTRRNANNIISVKNLDIRGTNIKIVSIEQCLIDCFLYNIKSGGINIITEVWETAINYFDQNCMLSILRKLNNFNLNRRIGFFFDYINYKTSSPFNEYLTEASRMADGDIQLLSDSNFVNKNSKWNIWAP